MLPGHSRRMVARGCVLVPSASAQIQPLGRETTAAPIALPAKQPIAGFRSGRAKIVQQSKGALPGSWNGSYYNQLQVNRSKHTSGAQPFSRCLREGGDFYFLSPMSTPVGAMIRQLG